MSSKLQALQKAGVITGDESQLSADFKQRIESLSDEEVQHLVNIKGKLGDDGLDAHRACMMA